MLATQSPAPMGMVLLFTMIAEAVRCWAIAVAAAFVALLTTPVLPSGLPVLAAALVAAVAGLLPRRPGAGPDGPPGPSAPSGTGAGAAEEVR